MGCMFRKHSLQLPSSYVAVEFYCALAQCRSEHACLIDSIAWDKSLRLPVVYKLFYVNAGIMSTNHKNIAKTFFYYNKHLLL